MFIEDLENLASCEKYGKLKMLRLKDENPLSSFYFETLEAIKSATCLGSDLEVTLKGCFSSYPEEAYLSKVEAEEVKAQDYFKFQRLIQYIGSHEVCAVNVKYQFPASFSMCGELVEDVTGKIDFLCRNEDGFEAINVNWSAPVLSRLARKFTNKIENGLELISMKLGLEKDYLGVRVSLFHMESKEDSAGSMAEFSEQEQVVRSGFESYAADGICDCDALLNHFYEVIGAQESRDCSKCVLCSEYRISRFRIPQKCIEPSQQKKRLTNFTPSQKEVVEFVDGAMSVIAVPGAGKTAVLTERLMRMVEKGVNPESILFVSFTNKACEEIRERVRSFLPADAILPEIITLNALGYKILKENKALLGNLKLADDICRYELIREAVGLSPVIRNMSYRGITGPFGLLRRLDKAFREIDTLGEDRFRKRNLKTDVDGVMRVKEVYDRLFKERSYITFDDQILLAEELLYQHPSVREQYSNRYQYICIDEFQDTDNAQIGLIQLIGSHGNVLVVGDDDQNIYRFRGSSNEYLLGFDTLFQGAKQVIMSDNFRSRDEIVSSFSGLIRNNKIRCEKKFVPHRTGGRKPVLFQNYQREQVVEYINSALRAGYRLGDISLISRTNKALESWAEFLKEFFPVSSVKDYLIEDEVFLLFKGLFEIVLDGRNGNGCDKAFYRLLVHEGISVPGPMQNCSSLYERLILMGMPYHGAEADVTPHNAETQKKLLTLHEKLRESYLDINYFDGDFEVLLRNLCHVWVGVSSHPVIDHLLRMADDQNFRSVAELLCHMHKLVVYGSTKRVGYDPEDCVGLYTAHDSKGKEFPVVVVCDVEDFSFKCEEEKEEERRLLFVAMSRAKDNLALFSSPNGQESFVPDLLEVVQVA